MRSIQQISCSLNLGFVYSLDYNYDPREGIFMKLYFVREDGTIADYQCPNPPQKCYIQVGNASFGMYPIRAGIELGPNQRTQWVEFRDDFFRLSHYYVALPGRGCGQNVFNLGRPVDNRTEAQKLATAVNRVAQQIKTLTQFPDYEYSFNEFLSLLGTRFSVSVGASFNGSITQSFEGSFEDVLSNWCNYYNLSFFFENGVIKIFDPTRLTITFPTPPADTITYRAENDITSTYGRTVCNWFQQDGGEYPLSQTSNSAGPLQTTHETLFPAGYEFGLPQTQMDLNQVAASMYGMNYWFLYNYNKGTTADQCGWTPITTSNLVVTPSILTSATSIGAQIAIVNPGIMEQRFEAYQQYGREIAGRYYLSNRSDSLSVAKSYTWFNESQGQITNFTGAGDKIIDLTFLTPDNQNALGTIDGTQINAYFPGVNYKGSRIVYRDPYSSDIAGNFTLSSGISNLVNTTYETLTNVGGSPSMDYSALNSQLDGAQLTTFNPITLPQELTSTFNNVGGSFTGFKPRFSSIPVRGIRTSDYVTMQASQSEPNSVTIVNGSSGPSVVTNTSVLKTLQAGSYSVYYDKYSKCGYSSSSDAYYGFRFSSNPISTDNQIGVTFNKLSNNTYRLNRDYGFVNSLVNNSFLPTLSQPRTFPTRRMAFSLNYFYDVPANFLSNGLVSISVTVAGDGINASYAFSNEMLEVPDSVNQFNKLAQQMRNSWIRTYAPKEVIT